MEFSLISFSNKDLNALNTSFIVDYLLYATTYLVLLHYWYNSI